MIIFTGVAGSGKSVQGKMLADYLGLPWLSTGEFLRMLISGERRKDMLAGKLIEDKEIISLVQKIFNVVDTKNEFILDGFPRTVAQDKKAVRKRLLARGRQDDTESAIEERFKEYNNSILPILEHFKDAGVPIHDITADQEVDIVQRSIRKQLKV